MMINKNEAKTDTENFCYDCGTDIGDDFGLCADCDNSAHAEEFIEDYDFG